MSFLRFLLSEMLCVPVIMMPLIARRHFSYIIYSLFYVMNVGGVMNPW